MVRVLLLVVVFSLGLWKPLHAAPSTAISSEVEPCLRAAASKYNLDYALLRAMAEHESRLNPKAIGGLNQDGSRDFGLMQINSSWLPTLSRWNIDKASLMTPCVNADVGAWILSDNFKRLGVTWNAVGAYNAKTPSKRVVYATGVYKRLLRFLKEGPQAPVPVSANVEATQAAGMGVWENADAFADNVAGVAHE